MKFLWLFFLAAATLFGAALTTNAQTRTAQTPHTPTRTDTIRERLRHPDGHNIIVCSHRGDWRNAAENSLRAIQNAIDMGVDIVEIDVQISKDGQIILMHDETLDRSTTGKGRVKDWTLDSLKTLKIRDGLTNPTHEHIPTLEEVMQLAKGRVMIYLDKAIDKIPELLALLRRTHTLKEGVFALPFTYSEARAKFGTYLDSVVFIPRIEDTVKNPQAFLKGYFDNFHPYAIQLRLPSEQSPAVGLSRPIRAAGISACISTMWDNACAGHDDDAAVTDPDGNWGWHISHGINLFNCDRPALLLSYLRSKGWHQ